MSKLAIFAATAALFLTGCDTHMQKVQGNDPPANSDHSPAPPPASPQPLASVPDGTQANIGNQANSGQPSTPKK